MGYCPYGIRFISISRTTQHDDESTEEQHITFWWSLGRTYLLEDIVNFSHTISEGGVDGHDHLGRLSRRHLRQSMTCLELGFWRCCPTVSYLGVHETRSMT
jgi:hypothetical protein